MVPEGGRLAEKDAGGMEGQWTDADGYMVSMGYQNRGDNLEAGTLQPD